MNHLEPMARIVISFIGGGMLGYIFFAGLWLTVRNFAETSAAMLFLSFLGRMSLMLAGMYWLAAGDWRAVLACLAGILVVRHVMLWQVSRTFPTRAG